MPPATRTLIAIFSAVALHVTVLALLERSELNKPVIRTEVTPLTYTIVEASILPPEHNPPAEVASNTLTTESDQPQTASLSKDAQSAISPLPIDDVGMQTPPSLPGLGLGVTKYFPTSALTARPKSNDQPSLALDRIEAFGKIRMTLYVSATGKLDDVTIDQTELAQDLSNKVRESVLKMVFTPGEISAQAVPSVMTIEVDIAPPATPLHDIPPTSF